MSDLPPEIVGWSTHHVELHADVVIKRHSVATRGDLAREWNALRLLNEHSPGLAPEPLALDESTLTMTMSRLPGESIPTMHRLDPALVTRVVTAFEHLMTALPPEVLATQASRSGDPIGYTSFIVKTLGALAPHSDATVERARTEVIAFLESPAADELRRSIPADVFTLGDTNLANFIDDGETIRFVDFEDAGTSDRLFELADLVEHLSSRQTPYEVWHAALEIDELTPPERHRYDVSRVLCSAAWLWLLFPGQPGEARNPADGCLRQAERVLDLIQRASGVGSEP